MKQNAAKRKKRILVSVINDLATDQRVAKVCMYLHERGYEVRLIGRKLPDSLPLNRPYPCKRFVLPFRTGPLFYAVYNLLLFFYLLFHRADVLLSNDLDTLLPNYLVAKMKRIRLVYDSHEYFTGVPELVNRPKVQRIWQWIEGKTLPKTDACYTVSPGIAEAYQQQYQKTFAVLRNVAPRWQPAEKLNRAQLGLPENTFLLIFQGAGINIHRGAEEMLEAMAHLPECTLLFAGSGDALPYLKSRAAQLQLNNVLFFPKRPYADLMQLTANADLGLSLDHDNNPNYQFSLPNKVFDYVQANTPVLASNIKEVQKLVNEQEIGLTIKEVTTENIIESIHYILAHPEEYQRWKNNCEKLAQDVCWENEVRVLDPIYPES